MKPLLVALVVLLPATSALAQNPKTQPLPPQVQPRREIHPGQSVQRPATGLGTSRSATRTATKARPGVIQSQGLSRNITLTFAGSVLGALDLDLDLTGCGPQFTTDFAGTATDKDTPVPIISVTAGVKETVGGLRVDYSLGIRVASPTSTTQGPGGKQIRNFEFRDMVLSGAVIVKPDQPVTLSKVNNKILTLTLTDAGAGKK